MSNLTFQSLQGEYLSLLSTVVVAPSWQARIDARAAQILKLAAAQPWHQVEAATAVKKLWGVASFEMEASSDYRCSPAQGDPWNRQSVNEPISGPFPDWYTACLWSYRHDGLDKVGAGAWTWLRALYEGELYNGFGYRAHGVHTPYLWSKTNHYTAGFYAGDGNWVPSDVSGQIGMVPLMLAMLRLDGTLGLDSALPFLPPLILAAAAPPPPLVPQAVPAELGGGAIGTKTIQADLNRIGAHLVVDGSYGIQTRRAVMEVQRASHIAVDGLYGPATDAVVQKMLADLPADPGPSQAPPNPPQGAPR